MSFFHKKKASTKSHHAANAANVHMTEAEAALAQSDFNIDKILDIQNKFTGGTALLVPGRIFIREGMLWKICRKGPKKRQFFLFNDILVYGSVVASRYSNQHVLPLAHMTVSGDPSYQPETNTSFNNESLDEQLDIHNAFQISHANKSFHVFSLSQADKANWLANLQKHINKVALVGGNQVVTPRAVWVPDSHSKECMVCGQRFTAFNRKHHCRQCGRVVCSTCSPHRVIIDTHADGKPERVCSECIKDLSVVKSKGSPESIAKPPPAAVAAQLVSTALRHNSENRSPSTKHSPPSPRPRRDSTDTEDSDDSEREDDTPSLKTKPTPVPRRTQSESARQVTSTSSPGSGPPQRPPPFASTRQPPVKPEPHAHPNTQREIPKPKPRTRKPDTEPATETTEDNVGGTGEGVVGRAGEEEGGEGKGVSVPLEESHQPTPPPRKRKKEKLKKQLEHQLQEQLQKTAQQSGQLTVDKDGEDGETVKQEEEEEREMEEREGEGGEEGEGGDEGEVQGAEKVDELEVVDAIDQEECVEREGGVGGGGEVPSVDVGEKVEGEGVVAIVPVVPEVESEEVVGDVRSGEGEVTVVPSDGEEVTAVSGDGVEVPGDEEEVTVVPGDSLVVTGVPGDGGDVMSSELAEEGREKEGPKRPQRKKKHFTGEDDSMDSDPREATPTDSTHIQIDSLADQDTEKELEAGTLTQNNHTENETTHHIMGQPISGQPESGRPPEAEDEAPLKKPKRRPKFKPVES